MLLFVAACWLALASYVAYRTDTRVISISCKLAYLPLTYSTVILISEQPGEMEKNKTTSYNGQAQYLLFISKTYLSRSKADKTSTSHTQDVQGALRPKCCSTWVGWFLQQTPEAKESKRQMFLELQVSYSIISSNVVIRPSLPEEYLMPWWNCWKRLVKIRQIIYLQGTFQRYQ